MSEDLHLTVRRVVGCGNTGLVEGSYSAVNKANGQRLDAQAARVWDFENGKVIRWQQYTDTWQFARVTGTSRLAPLGVTTGQASSRSARPKKRKVAKKRFATGHQHNTSHSLAQEAHDHATPWRLDPCGAGGLRVLSTESEPNTSGANSTSGLDSSSERMGSHRPPACAALGNRHLHR